MSKLSKERIQQIWDYELISAWDEKGYTKMWKVINNFINKVHPQGREGASFTDLIDYLVHLNLKRCLDVDHKTGVHTFQCFKQDVLGFIVARCEALSDDLFSGIPKPIILVGINEYKFKKLDVHAGSKAASKRRYAKKKDQADLKVRARSLSGKHDWNTIA
jgi:hypothetical protein